MLREYHFNDTDAVFMSRGTSVSIVSSLLAGRPGSIPSWGRSFFATSSRLALGPTKPRIQMRTGVLFLVVKLPQANVRMCGAVSPLHIHLNVVAFKHKVHVYSVEFG
jgi:hypothetical protein